MKTAAATIAAVLAAVAAHGAGIDSEYVFSSAWTLGDGDTVEHQFVGRLAQDDEGRTRLELQGRIDIVDPVAGVRWSASPAGQAFRFELRDVMAASAEMPTDVAVSRFGDEAHLADVPGLADFPQRDVTDLGPAVVNGLETTGMSLKRTIPAGAVGNSEQVVVEATEWRTEEYGFSLPVRIVLDYPFGRTVQELRNIRMLEPGEGADLFRPDPAWTVVDTPAQMPPGAFEAISALPDR